MAAVVIAPADRSTARLCTTAPVGSFPGQVPRVATVHPHASSRLPQAVYWRRRAMVLAIAGLLTVGVALVVGRTVAGLGARSTPPALEQTDTAVTGSSTDAASEPVYVIEPGDTLWSIAQRIAPGEDPRPIVDELAARAGGAALRPGQRISLAGIR